MMMTMMIMMMVMTTMMMMILPTRTTRTTRVWGARRAGVFFMTKPVIAAVVAVVAFILFDNSSNSNNNNNDSSPIREVQALFINTPSTTSTRATRGRRGDILKTTTTATGLPLRPMTTPTLLSSSLSLFSPTTTTPSATRLYHMMGHDSHSHHHRQQQHHQQQQQQHDHDDDDDERGSTGTNFTPRGIPTKTVLIRKLALVLVCFAFTCGTAFVHSAFGYKRALTKSHWTTFFVVSTAAWTLTSQKNTLTALRGTLLNIQRRYHNFKDGLQRHHGARAAGASAAAAAAAGVGGGGGGIMDAATFDGTTGVMRMSSTSTSMANDNRDADRVTWIGVVINLVLSIGKLAVGVTQHSSVLIADAGHSLSDLVSDFITLWSVSIARLPPDEDHPYGHSKFEAIGSLFLSLTLLATAVSVGMHSNTQLMQILSATASKMTTTTTTATAAAAAAAATAAIPLPGPLALAMAGISILSKEWLFRITRVVGRRLNSPVVLANAWHHRSDAYSSILALGSIAFAMAGFPAADAAAGMLVAVMIGSTGGGILMESVHQLSDSANEELQLSIAECLNGMKDEDVLGVTSIRARSAGSTAHLDVVLETMPDLSATATRAVEERVRRYLVHHLTSGGPGEGGGGRLAVTATIHAKPNVVFEPDCPLLQQRQHDIVKSRDHSHSHEGTTSSPKESEDSTEGTSTDVLPSTPPPLIPGISAAQVQYQVRQQALLMYPKIRSVQGVTVHYSSQSSVTVDVNIQVDMFDDQGVIGSITLADIQDYAHQLKERLETQSDEIEEARISLDLNEPPRDAIGTYQ